MNQSETISATNNNKLDLLLTTDEFLIKEDNEKWEKTFSTHSDAFQSIFDDAHNDYYDHKTTTNPW